MIDNEDKVKNKINNRSLFKLNLKYFIFQLIPVCIVIFIQFYQFMIVSIDRQIENVRRVIKTSLIRQYADLLHIKVYGQDNIFINKDDDTFNIITLDGEIKYGTQEIIPQITFDTERNELHIENVINIINKNITYKDAKINDFIDKYSIECPCNKIKYDFNTHNGNKLEVIAVFNSEDKIYVIKNDFQIPNFETSVYYSEEDMDNLQIQFFKKEFQIDFKNLLNLDGYYIFSMRYIISNSISFYIYLFIFVFFALFWSFSGQYFGIKRLVQNDSQLLNSFIEISMDSNLHLLTSQDDLQFPELFELGKKINGVSSIYSKLYKEISKNKMELQNMINNIPEQIFKIDREFNIINSNNVQTQMTEYFQYELNNNKFSDFVQDDESKNNLYKQVFNTFIERKHYYQNKEHSNRNERILNQIGQLQYQNYNLVEKITNEKQYRYQSFDITGIDIKIKTKSGKKIQTKCQISCLDENTFIVSLQDISHDIMQQEKINTLYNLQINLIKDDVNINKMLLDFQYIVKQDAQYILKINKDSLEVEYGVVTDNKNRELIDHQEKLDYTKLKDIEKLLENNDGELVIDDVDGLDNQYLKYWLKSMNIKTCILFKIEDTDFDILYSFGIDFIKNELTKQEIKEVMDLQRLFKNIIENYIIKKEYLKVSEEVNQKNIQILDNIFDFIYQIDENDKIIFANDKVQKALGKEVSDLLFKDYIEQLEINDFYQDKVRFDNHSLIENKMKIIEDSKFLLGRLSFRGTLLRKYTEIMDSPQLLVNFKQHQDISNIESMNKLINRKILFVDDIMLKVNQKGQILKFFIPFGQDYELLKIFKNSNSKKIQDIINDNIKNKEVQISLNSKIEEILNTEILMDQTKTIQFEDTFNINDVEHLKLRINFNRQPDDNINVIIQTKI